MERKINPVLNHHKIYKKMSNVINPYVFTQIPIMSFQTNKNGTFAPTFGTIVGGGTLRWNINGVDYITNSPSVALTGATVSVNVYANDVAEGAIAQGVQFQSQNIIGSLDFTWFTINTLLRYHTNPLLTSISFRNVAQSASGLEGQSCNISTLNFSNFTLTTSANLSSNANLTSLSFKSSGNTGSLRVDSTKIATLDISGWTISGLLYAYSNTSLTSIIFSSNANVGALSIANTRIVTLNLATFRVNGLFESHGNTALTSLSFANLNNNLNTFTTSGATSLTSINFTYTTNTGFIRASGCTSLSTVIWGGSITTGVSEANFINCALPTAQVDALYAYFNAYFQTVTPTQNLTINTSGGTNGSPTGGANNTDILALVARFASFGRTFTFAIN